MALLFLAAALVALVSPAALAADLLVPQQYPTIQAAIDASTSGDRVLVSNGVYPAFSSGGKSFTLRSQSSRALTRIAGSTIGGVGSEVRLENITVNGAIAVQSGALRLANVDLLTGANVAVTQGSFDSVAVNWLGTRLSVSGSGGPISIDASSFRFTSQTAVNSSRAVEVSNSEFINCQAPSAGAISSPAISAQGCQFIGCIASNGSGGAISGGGSLVSCIFQDTQASVRGGAVDGQFTITSCNFVRCSVIGGGEAFGGAISGTCVISLSSFVSCKVESSISGWSCGSSYGCPFTYYARGGAIHGAVSIQDSSFSNCAVNVSRDGPGYNSFSGNIGGGAVANTALVSACSFIDCRTSQGSVTGYDDTRLIGGAIIDVPSVRNCSFIHCSARDRGGAVATASLGECFVNSCFFSENSAGLGNSVASAVIGSIAYLSGCGFCGSEASELWGYYIEKIPNSFEVACDTDCNQNEVADLAELSTGQAQDCDGDLILDECELSAATDCDANGMLDSCDIANGAADCNANGVPDTCEPDCDSDGIPNACEIASGASDCDANGIPDSCQADCDDDGVIDACEIAAGAADCNANTIPDSCEIASGLSSDFNKDGVIDACQPSMQFAGLELEIVPIVNRGLDDLFPPTAVCYRLYAKTTLSASAVLGLFGNGAYPLSLSAAGGFWQSPSGGDLASQVPCNLSGALPSALYDSWFTVGLPCSSGNSVQNTGLDLAGFNTGGGIADNDGIIFVQPGAAQSVAGKAKRVLLAQLTTNAAVLPTGFIDVVGRAADGVGDWIAYGQAIPAPALVDCNGNGQQDTFDIALGLARDCDQSGIPDTCEYGSASTDCNMNGIPDLCDVTSAFSSDLNGNFIPDECECSGDIDGNGRVDVDDIIDVITAWGDTGNSAADLNNDGIVDAGDLVIVLAGYGSCL